MQASDKGPDGSRAEQAAQTQGAQGAKGRARRPLAGPSVRRAKRAAEWGKNKYTGSWAEHLWHQLDAADFMNQAMFLAATLLLCAVPFMLVTTALTGRSAVSACRAPGP